MGLKFGADYLSPRKSNNPSREVSPLRSGRPSREVSPERGPGPSRNISIHRTRSLQISPSHSRNLSPLARARMSGDSSPHRLSHESTQFSPLHIVEHDKRPIRSARKRVPIISPEMSPQHSRRPSRESREVSFQISPRRSGGVRFDATTIVSRRLSQVVSPDRRKRLKMKHPYEFTDKSIKDEGLALRQRTGSERVWWKDSGLLEGADLIESYGDESKPKLIDYTAKGEGKIYDVPASFLRRFAANKKPPTVIEEMPEDRESDTPNLRESENSSPQFIGKGLLNQESHLSGGRLTPDLDLIYPTTDKLEKIIQYAPDEQNFLDLDFRSPRPGLVFGKQVKPSLPDLSPTKKSENSKSNSQSPKEMAKRPGDLTTDAFAAMQKSIIGGESAFLESLHDSWYVAANKLDGLEATEGWENLSNYELRKNRQYDGLELSNYELRKNRQ